MTTSAETQFREEVREFVQSSLEPQTRAKTSRGLLLSKDDYVSWQKTLRRKGWFPLSWPKEHGGAGWPLLREKIFLEESVRQGAPGIIPFGVNMVGPVLHAFGTEAQKARFLPGILDSDTWWCQGYSEPNAGSDLASLTTAANRDSDHYIVNGSKIWTTDAQVSDMMHCLVRTDRSGRKQQGISFLLIDMRSPGISVQPIRMLDGIPHTNQVFFDSVRVPMENRIGAEGDGWKIAKFLLANERAFIDRHQSRLTMRQHLGAALKHMRDSSHPPADAAVMALRLAQIDARMTAMAALEGYYLDQWSGGRDDGLGASILKIRGTELLQIMAELWRDLQGPYAACYESRNAEEGEGLLSSDPWVVAGPVNYLYLFSRCYTIFGGSNEIQRNVIARKLLA